MIKNCVLALGFGLALSSAARAEVYGLDLRVEATERNCAAQKAVIERTVLSAGDMLGKDLSDVRVSCLQEFSQKLPSGQVYKAFEVNVRYSVSSAPAYYTAHWGIASGVPANGTSYGAYASLGECLDARAAELQSFERWTGLKAAFSACMPEQIGDGFVLTVTGFGRPQATLQALKLHNTIGGLSQLSQDEIQWVRNHLSTRGGEIRAVNGGDVIYFAPAPIPVRLQSMGHWYEASQCQKQVGDAASALVGATFHIECRSENLEIGSYGTDMRVLVAGERSFNRDFGSSSALYPDFDACREILPEVVQMERELHPTSFLGALCVPESFSLSRFKIEKWNRF